MVDDTMPVKLASMPILCVRILALEILTALLGVCSQNSLLPSAAV